MNKLRTDMCDYEDMVLLLEERYVSSLIVLLLLLVCPWVATRTWRCELRTAAVASALLCVILLLRAMYVDYCVIALGNEVDLRAERAFHAAKKRLSDRKVVRFLSAGMGDAHQHFYIAMMAAERGLHVPDAKIIARPGFFGTNAYSSFANGLTYPITYEELVRKYQQMFGHNRVKR